MALDLITAAGNTGLAELAMVKQRLGLTVSTYDSLLTDLIAEASQSIVSFLGFDLARQTYHETIAGRAKPYLLLSRFPVDRDSISILVNGIPLTSDGSSLTWRIHNQRNSLLFLSGGWSSTGGYSEGGGYFGVGNVAFGEDRNVDVTYTAGWLVPGMLGTWPVQSWAPSATYSAGTWVQPATPGTPLLFQCAAGGTSDSSEPAWPVPQVELVDVGIWTITKSQFSVVDGSVTWTSHDVQPLPGDIRKYCYLAVKQVYEQRLREIGLVSQAGGTTRWSFDPKTVDTDLPDGVKRGLEIWAMGRT